MRLVIKIFVETLLLLHVAKSFKICMARKCALSVFSLHLLFIFIATKRIYRAVNNLATLIIVRCPRIFNKPFPSLGPALLLSRSIKLPIISVQWSWYLLRLYLR